MYGVYSENLCCLFSSILVGLLGALPALLVGSFDILPLNEKVLSRCLCFGMGSILGEAILHLLPECWSKSNGDPINWGLPLLSGIIVFYTLERNAFLFQNYDSDHIQIFGYLNLVVNAIDNFTHGLSIGASYSLSLKAGLLTTSCIFLHELPHEMTDFAILLRSGFTWKYAVKAQLLTASTCLLGSFSVLFFNSSEEIPGILSFTAGGFMYISLVSLLPSIKNERSITEFIIQVGLMFLGVESVYIFIYFDS